jgi:predicted nucleotidyltransferase component of viral defense system
MWMANLLPSPLVIQCHPSRTPHALSDVPDMLGHMTEGIKTSLALDTNNWYSAALWKDCPPYGLDFRNIEISIHKAMLDPIQLREVFHLLFLRALVRSIPVSAFALKGGTNLRFFFGSIRYSEDMGLDVTGIAVHVLQEKVMKVFESSGLVDSLRSFGIDGLRLPDLARAKQTETVQRFKIGLLTPAGGDLATKIEFSRRGLDKGIRSEPVSSDVLAAYRMSPIVIPHYVALSAALQKVHALFSRAQPQPRDVFDLYQLSSQPEVLEADLGQGLVPEELQRTRDTIYSLRYSQYRDAVVSFLGPEDQMAYDSREVWDEIRLRVHEMIERGVRDDE